MEVFTIRNLTFAYPEQEKQAISDLTLSVQPGEFLVLCGPSGCGKSTLLRQLKTVLAPHGRRSGEILFDGKKLDELSQREQAEKIGFVQQSPENQIVTDKVWHELAFGLESLGYDTPTIRRRVAEMASFFGIQEWFYKPVTELSGGQKQLLNLASVMVLQPKVLILDEPTSQLDPIAASDFLATLGKINRELGTTIILTEHRLEEAFGFASRVAVMDGGKLLCTGTPAEVGAELKSSGNAMFLAMPAAMRIWAATDSKAACPISVCDGRNWLLDYAKTHELRPIPEENENAPDSETVISAQELWFKYDKDLPDVVKGLSLELHKGEFLALLGGNGTGKTTSMKLLAGLRKAYRGELTVTGTVGMLPQNPQALFVKSTVREDLLEILPKVERKSDRLEQVVSLCKLAELLDRHPYDLSGGEQQRAALAKILLLNPDILLLDEPTKGLDAEFKQTFGQILRTLQASGVAILMVSHDIEFCARYADRCALFFDGNIVTESQPKTFFSGNSFYTTSANRIARDVLPRVIIMLGIFQIFKGPHNAVAEQLGEPKKCDLYIGFSRDGIQFSRLNRKPFIAGSGVHGAWDEGYIHPASGICIVNGDELLFYFGAWSGNSPRMGRHMYAGGSTGVATLRRDGFAALTTNSTGRMSTPPVCFHGEGLWVNAQCKSLRAEIQDKNGHALPGLSFQDCICRSVNSTKQQVLWNSAVSLHAISGKPVRIAFELEQGKLFSFWISNDKSGSSGGYLAAGSVQHSSIRDETYE